MGRRWQGVLTIQGELASESDRRLFDLFTWRTPPLTLRVQTEDFGGHDGASPVATIETVELLSDGRRVWGTGTFSDTEPGQIAETWVGEGVLRGVSVDPGEFTYIEEIVDPSTGEVLEMEDVYRMYALADEAYEAGDEDEYAAIMEQIDKLQWQLHFLTYEIAAATLVATPAFKDAKIELVAEGEEAATGEAALVLADRIAAVLGAPAAPDGRTPAERLAALQPRASAADRLRALVGDKAGTLLASAPNEGGRPQALFSPGRTIAAPGAVFTRNGTGAGATRAARRQAAGPQTMRAPWFQPDAAVTADRSPWTITDEGRIMGYLYSWTDCHRSFGVCTPPPRQQEFPEFHIGQCRLDDGTTLGPATGNGIGVLTYADLHAGDGPADQARLQQLIQEDTGQQLGPVRLYADEFGVQCCGQVYEDVTPALVARALAGFPSGDWRDTLSGEGWRLYGLHVVNTPGYPWRVDGEGGARMVASMASTSAGHDATGAPMGGSCGCGGHAKASCGCGPKLSAAALADLSHLDTAMRAR